MANYETSGVLKLFCNGVFSQINDNILFVFTVILITAIVKLLTKQYLALETGFQKDQISIFYDFLEWIQVLTIKQEH